MLFLASASQRRTELLDLMQITHKVIPQDFDEDSIRSQDPIECSQQIVKGKNISARELLKNNDEDTPIMTADTLVFTPSNKIVGKPKDHDHSRQMLNEFSNQTHSVFSTVMISNSEKSLITTCKTLVTFKELSEDEIEEYVLSEEGVGKAGAYGIHGPAGKYITSISGSYTNVVGLPMHETYELLRQFNLA